MQRMQSIPDDQLQRLHWNYGGGRGAVGYRHLPSGITVSRECGPGVSHRELDQELLAELKEKLKGTGLIGK